MNIKETRIIELSMDDIKDAIYEYLHQNEIWINKNDIKLNSKELTENYPIGTYDYDTRIIGYDITARIENK